MIGISKARVLWGILGLQLTATSVRAQEAPQRPRTPDRSGPTTLEAAPDRRATYRGLFGSQRGDEETGQHLDLDLKLYGAYDDNLSFQNGSQETRNPFANRKTTYHPGSSATLDYGLNGDKLTMDVFSRTTVGYYPQVNDRTTVGESASGGLTWRIASSLTLGVRETFTYRPESALFSLDSLTFAPDSSGSLSAATLAFNNRSGYTSASTVNLVKTLGPRSSFTGHYTNTRSEYTGNDFNLRSQDIGGTFHRGLTEHAFLHLGYSYRRRRSTTRQPGIHDVDAGLDYGRPISLSRNTQFRFNTGSSIVQTASEDSGVLTRRFLFLGGASIQHEMGQSWSMRVQYQRGLTFLEGYIQPVLTDSVVGSVGGYLSRRVNIDVSARRSLGSRTTAAGGRAFGTTNASATARFALQRHAAAYAEYLFFGYKVPESARAAAATVVLPDTFPASDLKRVGLRAGVSLWVPLGRR